MKAKPDPDIKLVTIFQTNDAGLVGVVKSLLDSVHIDYFLRGEAFRNVVGWPGSLSSALGEAEFQVRETDAEQALILLKTLDDSDPGYAKN